MPQVRAMSMASVMASLRDAHVGALLPSGPKLGAVARARQLFVAGEEEQLVLDDRAAQREALGVSSKAGASK
jgi:hypothetical protein